MTPRPHDHTLPNRFWLISDLVTISSWKWGSAFPYSLLYHQHLQSACENDDTSAHARIDFVYIASHRLHAACLWFYDYCVVLPEHSSSLLAHYDTWVVNRLRSSEPMWLRESIVYCIVFDIYADSRVAINERFFEPLTLLPVLAWTGRTATIDSVRSCQHCNLLETRSHDLIVFPVRPRAFSGVF